MLGDYEGASTTTITRGSKKRVSDISFYISLTGSPTLLCVGEPDNLSALEAI